VSAASQIALWAARASRGKGYRIDPSMSTQDLLTVMRRWLVLLLRGSTCLLRGWHVQLPLFVGRGVSVRQAHRLRLGRGVYIGDCTIIDSLSLRGVHIGDGVTLAEFTVIKCSGTLGHLGVGISIGDNSAVGAFSYLGAAGGITIGSNVLLGQRVSVHAENHAIDRPDVPIREQGVTRSGVHIEDDCWIGSHTVILDGVTVGTGAVVGAGSVVTQDVPPRSIVAGIPARVMRYRGERPPQPSHETD
jgi:acetyltransferase-like isoleucine patch superfamily enzyme